MKYARALFLLFSCFLFSQTYAKDNHIGVVVFVAGDASATNSQQQTRPLKRRSKVFNGDQLTTTVDSKLQVRFIDGAIVSLREDSILKIDNYVYQPEQHEENSALSLLKGGFRTISGGIGKENYKVSTNMATIGIRGTHYEAVFDQDNLFVAAWDGGVKVKNEGGELDLGLGASYNFAQITHAESAPAGLSNPPSVFKQNYRTQASTKDKTKGEQKRAEKQPKKPAGESPRRAVLAEQQQQETTTLLPPPEIDTTATTTFTAKRNIKDINLNQLGIIAYSGPDRKTFYGGKAGYDAAGNPVITDNGLGPHEPGYDTTAPKLAFWKNSATTIAKGRRDLGGGYVVNWGVWDTSGGGTSIRQNDPEGLAFETDVQRNLFWATLIPTPATTLSALTGSATYTTSVSKGAVIGGGSGGAIDTSNFSFTANTNFDTGVVSGSMSISNADGWYVAFNGDPNNSNNGKGLVKGVLDVTVDSAASVVKGTLGVKADMGIVVTGANAEAVGGAFDLEAYDKSTNTAVSNIHAEGVFLAEQ